MLKVLELSLDESDLLGSVCGLGKLRLETLYG